MDRKAPSDAVSTARAMVVSSGRGSGISLGFGREARLERSFPRLFSSVCWDVWERVCGGSGVECSGVGWGHGYTVGDS